MDVIDGRRSRVDKFDERTLDDFRSAFNTFDKDGGGSIDATELKELMHTVCAHVHVVHTSHRRLR